MVVMNKNFWGKIEWSLKEEEEEVSDDVQSIAPTNVTGSPLYLINWSVVRLLTRRCRCKPSSRMLNYGSVNRYISNMVYLPGNVGLDSVGTKVLNCEGISGIPGIGLVLDVITLARDLCDRGSVIVNVIDSRLMLPLNMMPDCIPVHVDPPDDNVQDLGLPLDWPVYPWLRLVSMRDIYSLSVESYSGSNLVLVRIHSHGDIIELQSRFGTRLTVLVPVQPVDTDHHASVVLTSLDLPKVAYPWESIKWFEGRVMFSIYNGMCYSCHRTSCILTHNKPSGIT